MTSRNARAGIGARLREARIQAKLTQQDVATEFRRSRQAVSAWESGRAMPSLEEFRDLSMRYGVSADSIIHGVHDVASVGSQILGRASALARASLAAEAQKRDACATGR